MAKAFKDQEYMENKNMSITQNNYLNLKEKPEATYNKIEFTTKL